MRAYGATRISEIIRIRRKKIEAESIIASILLNLLVVILLNLLLVILILLILNLLPPTVHLELATFSLVVVITVTLTQQELIGIHHSMQGSVRKWKIV